MNNFFLSLIVLIAFVVVTSCSTDNDDNLAQVEGTWRLTEWNIESSFDFNQDGSLSTNQLLEFDCLNNQTIMFDSNNTGISSSDSRLGYQIILQSGSDNNYTIDIDCIIENDSLNFNWTRSGNIITIVPEEEGLSSIVGRRTSDKFIIVVSDGFVIFNESFDIVQTEDVTLVYTRQ